jgi:23S rRNA maturation-related 3'-5' exoribonuclease YhaM
MQQVAGLNEAIPSRDPGHVPKMQPSTMASRMQKEVHIHTKCKKNAQIKSNCTKRYKALLIRDLSTHFVAKSRMLLQAYFIQKGAELQSKQKEGAAKKQKYLQGAGGLKFTALAMASRDSN